MAQGIAACGWVASENDATKVWSVATLLSARTTACQERYFAVSVNA